MTIVERLEAEYSPEERRFVRPVTKATVIALLGSVAGEIERMDDFDRFPEGAVGVTIYALLRGEAFPCPDAGDFAHVVQGFQKVVETAAKVISADTFRRDRAGSE